MGIERWLLMRGKEKDEVLTREGLEGTILWDLRAAEGWREFPGKKCKGWIRWEACKGKRRRSRRLASSSSATNKDSSNIHPLHVFVKWSLRPCSSDIGLHAISHSLPSFYPVFTHPPAHLCPACELVLTHPCYNYVERHLEKCVRGMDRKRQLLPSQSGPPLLSQSSSVCTSVPTGSFETDSEW